MKNIFEPAVTAELINRINKLSQDTVPKWGKMTVDQMLAHCNVTYELAYEDIHPRPNPVMRFLLGLMVKKSVVGEKPYPPNTRTAPMFLIKGPKDFDAEKSRLIAHLQQTVDLGASHFEGRESHSLGALSQKEWSNMFYKHLDHHLLQFGV